MKKQFLIKFKDLEEIFKQLTPSTTPYPVKKIENIKKKFIRFFKSSGQFVIKFNDLEGIMKQLTPFITPFISQKIEKVKRKFINFFF